MRKAYWLLISGLLIMPGVAGAATFKDVPVVDVNCSSKVASAPDTHTRDCALKCAASGYGIVTSDQKFIKFDANGNKMILSELKASDKKDHLRVNVSGDVQGDTMTVKSVKLL